MVNKLSKMRLDNRAIRAPRRYKTAGKAGIKGELAMNNIDGKRCLAAIVENKNGGQK